MLASLACAPFVTPALGSPVNTDYVTVGNPGNAADTTGYGSVGYVYQIGKYEVTNTQYAEFLNAKGSSNSYGIYNPGMASYGITQVGSPGSYSYNVASGFENRPVVYVSWFDAARFTNWLGNGQGSGSTETGAYTLSGATTGNAVAKNTGAAVYLPSENEWYKAAYYNGGTSTYSLYPNGHNSITTLEANYDGSVGHSTDVGSYSGAPSSYGTFDQGGNVWEWNDFDALPSSSRGIRGGPWDYGVDLLESSLRYGALPSDESYSHGFRVASDARLTVANVRATQRTGTKLVDITYDVTADTPTVVVSLEISNDGGATFSVPSTTAIGAIGERVAVGTGNTITWDAGADWNQQYNEQMRFRVTANDTPSFALIPAGQFQMGDQASPLVGYMNERPVHTVQVSAYYMGKYEVTKGEWDVVRAWAVTNGYTDLATGVGKAVNHPVQTVSWWDVIKWCNARSEKEGFTPCYTVSGSVMKTGTNSPTVNWAANGYRLPSEAEWENAARGGLSGKNFPWGDTASHTQANFYNAGGESYQTGTTGYHPTYNDGVYPYSSPVGSFAPNGYGLYDMAGNVWEWCWDWFGNYASGTQTDPRGADSGSYRVLRGGSWGYAANACRVACRGNSRDPGNETGLRLVRISTPTGDSVSAVTFNLVVDTCEVSLTTNAQHGAVSSAGQYALNATAILTATADPGYAFTDWSGDATGSDNPLSLLMDANKTITANFIANAAPVFTGYAISTPFQTAATVSLRKLLAKASDPDGDAISVTAAGPASGQSGTAVLQAPGILYTPPVGFSGTDTFSVTLTDAHGAATSGTVTVHVGPSATAGGMTVNPPVMTVLSGGHIGLKFHGIPQRTYQIQRSTDMSTWGTIATVTADSTGAIAFTDELPPQPSAFYRLALP